MKWTSAGEVQKLGFFQNVSRGRRSDSAKCGKSADLPEERTAVWRGKHSGGYLDFAGRGSHDLQSDKNMAAARFYSGSAEDICSTTRL